MIYKEKTALDALAEMCGVAYKRRRKTVPMITNKEYVKSIEANLKEKGLKKCITEKLDEIHAVCCTTGCDFADYISDRLVEIDDLLEVYGNHLPKRSK